MSRTHKDRPLKMRAYEQAGLPLPSDWQSNAPYLWRTNRIKPRFGTHIRQRRHLERRLIRSGDYDMIPKDLKLAWTNGPTCPCCW